MFIISEISPQFGTDLDVAEQMILQSKLAGANAVKLQLYPIEMFISNPDAYLRERELSFDEFRKLKEYGDRIGIPVFATAFTEETLEWCIEVDQLYYKIAARQHRENPALVEKTCARAGKLFISVPADYDMSTLEPLPDAIYLHCIGNYPTLLEEFSIPDFSNSLFSGISDHTLGIAAALYAASHGCQYLEKHFTLSHAMQLHYEKGHLGAMDFDQLRQIKTLSREIQLINRS